MNYIKIIIYYFIGFLCNCIQCDFVAGVLNRNTSPRYQMNYVKRINKFPDVKTINNFDIQYIKQQILEHGVIAIPKQKLSLNELTKFAKNFGNIFKVPKHHVSRRDVIPGDGEIIPVSNFWTNGSCKGKDHAYGQHWHKDGSFMNFTKGYLLSILYAEKYDENIKGGGTGFIKGCQEEIPEKIKDLTTGKSIIMDLLSLADYKSDKYDSLLYPKVDHKVLFEHPENGKQCLFLFKGRNKTEVSDDIYGQLWNYLEQHENRMDHQWKTGDILIWDNYSVFHRALPLKHDCLHKRDMFRTLVNVDIKKTTFL